jgi:hypothetical protein
LWKRGKNVKQENMGLFDFFKKDKKKEPKVDFTVNEMKKGFIVDYSMKSWEVKKVSNYNWGNNYYSKEYILDAGDEKMFLNVEDDDGLVCSIWSSIDLFDIDQNLAIEIRTNDEAPNKLLYANKTYVRKESSQAVCEEEGVEGESKLVNWTYQHSESKECISINRWGEEEFDASVGTYIKAREFSNILPR